MNFRTASAEGLFHELIHQTPEQMGRMTLSAVSITLMFFLCSCTQKESEHIHMYENQKSFVMWNASVFFGESHEMRHTSPRGKKKKKEIRSYILHE